MTFSSRNTYTHVIKYVSRASELSVISAAYSFLFFSTRSYTDEIYPTFTHGSLVWTAVIVSCEHLVTVTIDACGRAQSSSFLLIFLCPHISCYCTFCCKLIYFHIRDHFEAPNERQIYFSFNSQLMVFLKSQGRFQILT